MNKEFKERLERALKNNKYIDILELFSNMEGLALAGKGKGTSSENQLMEVILMLIDSNKTLVKKLLEKQ